MECWRSIVSKFAQERAKSITTDLIILNYLQKQLKPKYNHPKKLHDKSPDGSLYCMGVI